jgi:DNA-binding NtrC family response regulator
MVDLQSIKNRFGIIGSSPALNYALQVAVQVANTDLTVLIAGESGVGKEAFSHIIHSLSARKHNPFIAVNCGAIPEGTIDSELFGHEKGSFTSAVESRKGYFETVNGGTIFLDEIGEMPLGTQARLLRVLESGEFIRVGSSKMQKTDVRVIAASNKELLQLVQAARFREDLYYRLNTVPIRVPALRDRKEDIPLLFRKFVIDFAERYKTTPVQLDDAARERLVNYTWPGNVRELKNIGEQISVLATEKQVNVAELSRFLPESNMSRLPVLASKGNGHEFNNEREILYKLFFDMKRDVTELKKLFLEVLQNPSAAIQNPAFINELKELQPHHENSSPSGLVVHSAPKGQPVPMAMGTQDGIDEHVEVEESLNIMDKEKELIIKALKKHKGKRKDAAMDLGISERTLYRKLKEYYIEE